MAAAKPVPFKGRSSGVVTIVSVDATFAHTSVEAQGQATNLGRFRATALTDVELSTGNAHGAWTLTAANGDKLFLEMTAVPSGDATHGIAAFKVMGGTGRFEGATGSYTQTITFDSPPGASPTARFTDVLEGTISFGH
jgi:hypothetical protein